MSVEQGEDGLLTFSGSKIGSDAGVCMRWPKSPRDKYGGLDTGFVGAVLSDLQGSEDIWDDDESDF